MSFRNLILLSFIIILLSCRGGFDDNRLKIFRYNEAANITSLDPAFSKDLANIWACNQLYDGLVSLNDELTIIPSIASSWIISEDGKTYTFIIRDDVFFHDHAIFPEGKGRQVKAPDFEYSFNRIINPSIASPGAWVFNQVEENGFKALNDSVFEIRLKEPFMPFLGLLAMQYCSVVPMEIIEEYGKDFRKAPIGCGPFYFKYWKEGVKLVFRKNESYHQFDETGIRLPYLDAVAITFLIDKQSAFLQFIQGKIDFLSGIDASYKDELLTPQGDLNPSYHNMITLIAEPYLNTEYLGIMVDTAKAEEHRNPLLNKQIRQAINYGFDRRKMMLYLRNNIGIPGNAGIIPAGMPSFDTSFSYGYKYDPQLSALLLEEAGFPEGKGLPTITISTSPEYLDLCKYIQHELTTLGISVEISVSPPAAIKEMKSQAKIPFFRASWIADYPDAENYLSLFYSKNFCPAGPNYTHYSNPAYDSLYLSALGLVNDSIRFEYYREMDRLVMEDSPVIILFYDEVLRFIRNDVSGLGSNPINMLDLTRVDKKNKNQ